MMKGCTGLLKKRIQNGDTLLVGCIMDCRSGTTVGMYHECGYDVVMIDREHTALNSEPILEHLRLCRAFGIPSMVRVADVLTEKWPEQPVNPDVKPWFNA